MSTNAVEPPVQKIYALHQCFLTFFFLSTPFGQA